jgi:PHD/YefM family antitoxin component YafN of YafNO toxin-antitoxin module
MLDTRQIHPMSDFVRNPKAHVARLKETRTPEVLTINGRAEVVLLDTETYEALMARVLHAETVAEVRAVIRRAEDAGPREDVPEAELARSRTVVEELMAETERLGLYRGPSRGPSPRPGPAPSWTPASSPRPPCATC